MKTKAIRYLLCGQAAFFISIIVQICLRPEGLTNNGGISYYSVLPETIILYILGFILSIYCLWQASNDLPQKAPFNIIANGLKICAVILLGLTLSPDISGTIIDKFHIFFGSTLFASELCLGMWLALYFNRNLFNIGLVLLQLGAGIICFLSIINLITYQTEGQIVFQLLFAVLIDLSIISKLPKPVSA